MKISGVLAGSPFLFLSDFLGIDESGDLSLTTPHRIEVTERRKQARTQPKAGMMLRIAIGGRHLEADIVDVSENGIAFDIRDLSLPLVEGTRLEARIDLLDNRFVPVEVIVRYIEDSRAGAVFLSIPQAARSELRRLTVPETHVVGRIALP
ncbi:MAG TPA: PilZ domain-containing protein [Myxococcota bacterium]|nr:PilZ domain-containing protein [Myxococcota bacterium]